MTYRTTHYEVINGTMDVNHEKGKITFWYQYKSLLDNPVPFLNETPEYIYTFIRNNLHEELSELYDTDYQYELDRLEIHYDHIENEFNRIIEGTYRLPDKKQSIIIKFEKAMYTLIYGDREIILNDYSNQHYDFHELEIVNGCFMEKLTKFVKENLTEILKER